MIIDIGMPWITVSDLLEAKKLFIHIMGFNIHEENVEYNWLEIESTGKHFGIVVKPKLENLKKVYSIDKLIDWP
jgi:hypothetical protein